MTPLEIFLIVIGLIAIAISYFISDKISEKKLNKAARDYVLSEETKESLTSQTKTTIEDLLEGLSGDIAVKAERELEKLSNEKIMAVKDYSDGVLDEINKGHNEVMFLYSMLDDKDRSLKERIQEVNSIMKNQDVLEEVKSDSPLVLSTEKQKENDVQEEYKRNNNEDILRLHYEGKSNLDIAKELGIGLGEVLGFLFTFQEEEKNYLMRILFQKLKF